MGSCFSISSSGEPPATTAKVVNPDGTSLTEYSQPIEVLHVLGNNHPLYFLCNADELFYGHHIPALEANQVIELGNLYFMLPAKKLSYPVTAAEMAALASNASSALAGAASKRGKTRSNRVVPAEFKEYEEFNEEGRGSWRRQSAEVKEKAASWGGRNGVKVMRFRPRLNVIHEVPE